MEITCYGGINEIGGNKFLIKDKDTKIFLDFGQSFGLLDDYFVDWLQPRERFGLRDYFALDLMPKIEGLYNDNALKPTDMKPKEPDFDAVFISHAHYDHVAHLKYLHEKIPIYMGETCKTILESHMQTAGSFFFTEEGFERPYAKTYVPPNTLKTFRTGNKITLGTLEIVPVHVDHSVPGAYGFIIHGSEGSIAYTGDIRRHGSKPELTDDFIAAAREAGSDALLVEGTRVAPEEKRKNHTEQSVYSNGLEVANRDRLILAMRYPKDLDRFRTFHDLAKATGKTLVTTVKTAHLLLTLNSDIHLDTPHPFDDPHIKVYAREMLRPRPYEAEIRSKFECVGFDWVKKHQNKIIWELDFSQLQELIDVKPEPGGACIHSMSEPFEEDPMSQLQDEILHNWLNRFSMEHHQLHASGHASKDEIFEMCKTISPKKIIPVHTQYAELFKESGLPVYLAGKGEAMEL
ncbi:MAG: MBL fold metallo-hydrolase [Candidatus Micrarchaeota archaeon]